MDHCADTVQVARCQSRSGMLCSWTSPQSCVRREEGLPRVAAERYVFLHPGRLGDDLENLSTVCAMRLNELYTATALQHSLRPSCDHEVFLTKACYE